MARLCWLFCFLLFSIPLPPANGQQESNAVHRIEELGWMAGSWTGNDGRMDTEEHWLKPKGGMMLGVNRTSKGDKGTFEFLRIQQKDDALSYFASPSGRTAVEFKLKQIADGQVVFENLENDFPQRILYHRQGDQLSVRIEGEDQGQIRSTSWTWKLAR